MEERLSGPDAKAKFRKTNCSDWKERAWLDNACEHLPSFDAIVATAAPMGTKVLVAGEFLRDEPPYARAPQISIPRTVSDIIGSAWPLVAQAEAIVLVEPNFNPTEPRFLEPLVHLLEQLHSAGAKPKRFEIHTCKFSKGISRVNPVNYRSYISPHLPVGWTLKVCFWAERLPELHLHARFILTEIGGIQYYHGLDVGETGSTTLVSGLGEAEHQKRFSLYFTEGTAFRSESANETISIS
jgi:hypothetical protein